MGASYHNNVLSVGVTYSWEALDPMAPPSAPQLCSGTTTTTTPDPNALPNVEDIKRVETMTISTAQVNLSSTAGVISSAKSTYGSQIGSSSASSHYIGSGPDKIFLGNGNVKSATIREGSNSNVIITDITYENVDTRADPNDKDEEETPPDPISKTEEITVSRDIKNKAYRIAHNYSVSYGSDFKAVTNHPKYAGSPKSYETASARLELAKAQAEKAVFGDVKDYNEYLDLSAFQNRQGWNQAAIKDGCSGLSYSTSTTKDYINGDYSLSKVTEIKYTGQDLESGSAVYDVSYSIDWTLNKLPDSPTECLLMTMKGDIKGKGAVGKNNCEAGLMTEAQAAQSGYEEWVEGGSAEQRMREVFGFIIGEVELDGVDNGDLNPGMTNLKVSTCNPSIEKGEPNDGQIDFEFEMDNCKGARKPKVPSAGSPYTHSETQSESYSWEEDCLTKAPRKITSFTVNGSVGGVCGTQHDYKRWDSVADTYEALKESGKETASSYSNDEKWAIVSESDSVNKYDANGSYSFTYSDKGTGCKKPSKYNKCMTVESEKDSKSPEARIVTTYTSNGIIEETRGSGRAQSNVKLTLKNHRTTGCSGALSTFLETAKDELNDEAPECIIQELSWTFNKNWNADQDSVDAQTSLEATMGGID
jgi:hypothetical protein